MGAPDESIFDELKRFVRFGVDDEAALRTFAPHAEPHFSAIVDEFYARLSEHDEARRILGSAEQIGRLKLTLHAWMVLLLEGPWDEQYFQRRLRIGEVHVRVNLPQRYMFGAMNLIRLSLTRVAQQAFLREPETRHRVVLALSKILDLELAVMMHAYGEAYLKKAQELDRRERELLRERLALTEARYLEIVEHAEALITTLDRQGRILLVNGRAEQAANLPRSELVGRSWLEIYVDERHRAGMAEHGFDRKDPIEAPTPGARRVRWQFTTLPDHSVCAIGLDVTEAHELAQRTARAERLASLGTMAAGLAHEIRNPLNAAHLQLTLARRRLARAGRPDTDGAMEAADLVEGELRRLAALVNEFLQFARPLSANLSRSDLRTTAEEVIALLLPEARENRVELVLRPGARATVEQDEEHMKQVVLNLVRNALEATGPGGHVEVDVEVRDGAAHLRVEDDGPGFAPDAPVFEPFYTTKPGGTGLGLTIVHRIVSDHLGRITVESRPGRTVFDVALPLAAGTAAAVGSP